MNVYTSWSPFTKCKSVYTEGCGQLDTSLNLESSENNVFYRFDETQ